MPESVIAPVADPVAPASPTLGALTSLSEFRARRAEASPASPPDAPEPVVADAVVAEPVEPVVSPDASTAGKALAAKKGSLQARIDEITRERHTTATERDTARAEAAALRAELAALKIGQTTPEPAETAPAFQPTSARPTADQFNDWDAYQEALVDWKIDQRDAKAAHDAEQARIAGQHATAEQAFTETADAWIARRDAFAAAHPDFTTDAMPFLEHLQAGTPLGDAIMASEHGPAVALYLAQHQDEVARIVRLPWMAQALAIGAMAAHHAPDVPKGMVAPAVKPLSSAPAPIEPPVAASASAGAADPAKISSLTTWRRERARYLRGGIDDAA